MYKAQFHTQFHCSTQLAGPDLIRHRAPMLEQHGRADRDSGREWYSLISNRDWESIADNHPRHGVWNRLDRSLHCRNTPQRAHMAEFDTELRADYNRQRDMQRQLNRVLLLQAVVPFVTEVLPGSSLSISYSHCTYAMNACGCLCSTLSWPWDSFDPTALPSGVCSTGR